MLKPDYIRDGGAIYERSFAIIRAEADLSGFTPEQADVAVRMIHACAKWTPLGQSRFRAPSCKRRGTRFGGVRRSFATRRWWPMASPARGCPPTTM